MGKIFLFFAAIIASLGACATQPCPCDFDEFEKTFGLSDGDPGFDAQYDVSPAGGDGYVGPEDFAVFKRLCGS